MNYVLAIFRSRSETIYFANLLKMNGLPSSVINTPKEAGQTCGISVKFLPECLGIARGLLTQKRFQSFAGFYRVTLRCDGSEVRRIG